MLVGGGHAGEQGIANQAISWYQSVSPDFVAPYICKLWNQTSRPKGALLFAGMAASYWYGRTVWRWIWFAHLDAEGRVPPGTIFRDRKSRTRRDRMSLRTGPDQAGS